MTLRDIYEHVRDYSTPAPVAVFAVASFIGLIAMMWETIGPRQDALLILVGLVLLLILSEFGLSRRFARHEQWEQSARKASLEEHTATITKLMEAHKQDYERALMVREGYAAVVESHARKVSEFTAAIEAALEEWRPVKRTIDDHEKRLTAIEDRFMRAGLRYPTPPRPPTPEGDDNGR